MVFGAECLWTTLDLWTWPLTWRFDPRAGPRMYLQSSTSPHRVWWNATAHQLDAGDTAAFWKQIDDTLEEELAELGFAVQPSETL
ncbi:MAG: hypothetical protein ABI895_13305 [Deltaproteobacteria bacterium]